jgi:WD40 repeat protein
MLAGGGLFCDRPHLLSRDGSLLFVCCVDSVVAYSTGTGEQAFTLQHAAAATALSLHPTDDSRLYSGSKDGLVTLWDLPTGTEVQRWRVESPVESLVVAEDAGGRQQHMHSPLHAARLLLCGLPQGGETHTMYVGIAACPPV